MQWKNLVKHTLVIGMVYNFFPSVVDWHFKKHTCMLRIQMLKGYTLYSLQKYRQYEISRQNLGSLYSIFLIFQAKIRFNGSSVIFVQVSH